MDLPILKVAGSQCLVVVDHEIFRVVLLRGLGEIEGAGNNKLFVNDHDFVMSDRVLGINEGRDSLICQKISRGIFCGLITLIQDHFHMNSSLMGS